MNRAVSKHPVLNRSGIALCLILLIGGLSRIGIPLAYSRAPVPQEPTRKTGDQQTAPPATTLKQRSVGLKDKTPAPPTEPSTPPPPGAQNYALLIGISKYQNLPPEKQLNYADQDAQALAEFLISPQGGFSAENVILLKNEDATRAAILDLLDQLRDTSKESLVLIYFAGHGEVLQAKQGGAEQGFLLPYDVETDSLPATAIQMDAFNNIIGKLRSRSVVVITDACQSGTIGDLATQTRRGVAVKDIAEAGLEEQSSFILSAASPAQSSLELSTLKHGIFTHHLLQGLRGQADRDQNGLVTAGELFGFVRTRVLADTQQQQEPESNNNFDYSIPLAILNEEARTSYRQWFAADPLLSRWSASFDEALRGNRLTTPEGLSAWFFYRKLQGYVRAPKELLDRMSGELLRRFTEAARAKIDEAPRDPAEWKKAADWLEKADDLAADKNPRLRAWRYFCRGMERYYDDNQDLRRAAHEFDLALSALEDERLNEPAIAARIGRFYRQQRKWSEASRAYKLATAERPQAGWRREYAEVLKALEKWSEAKTQLRAELATQPDDVAALRLLVEVWLASPQPTELAEATQAATRVHELAPNDIEIEDLYGQVCLQAGQVAPALAALRKVARHYLDSAPLRDQKLLQLSRAYLQHGDAARAISALREAERQQSKSVEVYDLLAQLFAQQGELDLALNAARQALATAPDKLSEKAKRHRTLATHYERAGQLEEAAVEYKNAADLTSGDSRTKSALETHAQALLYRLGKKRAEARHSRPPSSERATSRGELALTVPGGRAVLERLTGVNIDASNEHLALARVFDVCLRQPEIRTRLLSFFEHYPEFMRRAERKGPSGGQIELPAPSQTNHSETLRDVLRFFGVSDNKGKRQINRKDFDLRKILLVALGSDPAQIERGEALTLKWKNEQLPISLGVDWWLDDKEGINARENRNADLSALWRVFLKNDLRLKLYVGAALLPEEFAGNLLFMAASDQNKERLPIGLYFAAPYLRFTPQGRLWIPGNERVWRESLKNFSHSSEMLRSLLKEENTGSFYLFAALSAAGPVGDYIARSSHFKTLVRALQKSPLPAAREPFDLLDLFALLRLDEKESLRLSPAVEAWLGVQPDEDVLVRLLAKLGTITAGKQLPLVKQMAALAQLERERPDWFAAAKLVEPLAKQVTANREALLEVALDLELSGEQLERWLARAATFDALTAQAEKLAALRADQAAFELLRLLARKGALAPPQVAALTERLLALQPGGDRYAFELFALVQRELLGMAAATDGQEVEDKLIAALVTARPLLLPTAKTQTANDAAKPAALFAQFEPLPEHTATLKRALETQRHTRLAQLARAIHALDALEANSADAEAIKRLQTALSNFGVIEPPKDPKKKTKEPVKAPPSLKELAAGLSAPVSANTLAELRRQIAPFVGEALLGALYAAFGNLAGEHLAANPELVRQHDLSGEPWGRAEFDSGRRAVRGSIARLGSALATLATRTPGSGTTVRDGIPTASFTAAVLDAQQLGDARRATFRAIEYVARTLDLGEDLLALSALRLPVAETTLNRSLEELLSPRRALLVRSLLDQGDVKRAIQSLTSSELYFLGRRFFKARRNETPLVELANEPGASSVLARLLKGVPPNAELPAEFEHELRQFGMAVTLRAGLKRLELRELEPYEQALNFNDALRLAERVQDLKLSLARAVYRQSNEAPLPHWGDLLRAALKQADRETMAATQGAPLAERDWQGLQAVLNDRLIERTLKSFLLELGRNRYLRALPDPQWSDAQ